MDWTKAKNILIIALLITNAIVGTTYALRLQETRQVWTAEAAHATEYFDAIGVSLNTEIPAKPVKLPVLFVRFDPATEDGSGEPVYDGKYRVETGRPSAAIASVRRGENKRQISSASYALLKYAAAMEARGEAPQNIDGIELLYLVDQTEHDGTISEDTAVPAWKLTLAGGETFYVNAYGE
jgi:hypothetical protein